MEITTDDGVAIIPIEDLVQIMAHGANIRLSTMDLSILTQNKISIMTLDDKYLPTAIVLPFEGHARHSKLMHAQVRIQGELRHELWMEITRQKIINQSRALSILGKDGAEIVAQYANTITTIKTDFNEALAAVVRMFRLTEKQYDNITKITGEPDYQEQTVGTNCHIMI